HGGSFNGKKCVPVLGDGMAGEPCTHAGVFEATDSCDEHSVCWNAMYGGGNPTGTCVEFCSGSPDDPMCSVGSSCVITSSAIPLCLDQCDPLAQDCADGLGCYWATEAFLC